MNTYVTLRNISYYSIDGKEKNERELFLDRVKFIRFFFLVSIINKLMDIAKKSKHI